MCLHSYWFSLTVHSLFYLVNHYAVRRLVSVNVSITMMQGDNGNIKVILLVVVSKVIT